MALLIFAMASLMLGGMMNAAGSINTKTREKDAAYLEALNAVERCEPKMKESETETAQVIIKEDSTEISIEVTLYGKEGYPLTAYGK